MTNPAPSQDHPAAAPAAGRVPGWLATGLAAMGGYAAVRLLGLVVLWVAGDAAGRPLLGLLTNWDGGWYLGIAEHGYDTSITYADDGHLRNTNIAFFPLFPWLVRALVGLGLSGPVAAVTVAGLTGLAAAWGIALVGAHVGGRPVGLLLAVLWGALPHAVVQNMAYTESLFTALAAWALWAVLERRWVLAGALAAVAGLARPTAVAIVAAVAVACIVQIFRGRPRAGAGPWLGALLAPVGYVGYLAWCAVQLHRPDAYFWMQDKGWASRVDFGWTTVRELALTATHVRQPALVVTSVVLVLAVAAFALLVRDTARHRWPLPTMVPLLVFAGLVLLTTVVQGGPFFYAKGRFLLPAFPLLLPVAVALAAARPALRWGMVAVLAGFSAWYGQYLLIEWFLSP